MEAIERKAKPEEKDQCRPPETGHWPCIKEMSFQLQAHVHRLPSHADLCLHVFLLRCAFCAAFKKKQEPGRVVSPCSCKATWIPVSFFQSGEPQHR